MATTPNTLIWNTFTGAFMQFINVDCRFKEITEHKVIRMFEPWIEQFGYPGVRKMFVRYMDYLMEGACYWSVNYDLLGYKPEWYDHKFTKGKILLILDENYLE